MRAATVAASVVRRSVEDRVDRGTIIPVAVTAGGEGQAAERLAIEAKDLGRVAVRQGGLDEEGVRIPANGVEGVAADVEPGADRPERLLVREVLRP